MNVPNITDWITAIAALVGVVVACWQLRSIALSLRTETLMAVLEMEQEMNRRKEKLDEAAFKIRELASAEGSFSGTADNPIINIVGKEEAQILRDRLNVALENYLNALDRLCYCILAGYLPNKEWKLEYRDYVNKAVEDNKERFGNTTPYRNVLKIYQQWKGE